MYSVELFADDGLLVMTAIFFPTKTYNKIELRSDDGAVIRKIKYAGLKQLVMLTLSESKGW
jgi:fructan beta-fructosidase